jgi:hypothetical protein
MQNLLHVSSSLSSLILKQFIRQFIFFLSQKKDHPRGSLMSPCFESFFLRVESKVEGCNEEDSGVDWLLATSLQPRERKKLLSRDRIISSDSNVDITQRMTQENLLFPNLSFKTNAKTPKSQMISVQMNLLPPDSSSLSSVFLARRDSSSMWDPGFQNKNRNTRKEMMTR